MEMMRAIARCACGLVLGGLAGIAQPATVSHSDPFAFLQAVQELSLSVEGFERWPANQPVAAGQCLDGLCFESFGAAGAGRIDAVYAHRGTQGLAAGGWNEGYFLPGDELTLRLQQPVLALGVWIASEWTPADTLYLSSEAGRVGNGAEPTFSPFYFLGLVSSTPLDRFRLGAEAAALSGYVVDDVIMARAVPEPAPWALLALAATALLLTRRPRFRPLR